MDDIRKIISEREIVKRLEAQGLLLPPLRFEVTKRLPPDSKWDLLMKATWKNQRVRFAVECKALSTPKAFEDAIRQVQTAARPEGYLPLIIMPYLRESQLLELEQLVISGVDLCGNGVVLVPKQLAVFRTGAENQFPSYAPIKNVYRRNSSMVARALLSSPYFQSVQELNQFVNARSLLVTQWSETPMQLSTVSKALKQLEQDLIVDRSEGVRLVQAEKLLDQLQQNYERPRLRKRLALKLDESRGELVDLLNGEARSANLPIIATGLASLGRYAVMQRRDVLSIYCPQSAALTDRLRGKENERFPNVEILETDDQPVYFDAQGASGFPWASPVQTYLELMSGDKRDRETAQQVRKSIIRPVEGAAK